MVDSRSRAPISIHTKASSHDTARAVITAMHVLGAELKKAAEESETFQSILTPLNAVISEAHQRTSQTQASSHLRTTFTTSARLRVP